MSSPPIRPLRYNDFDMSWASFLRSLAPTTVLQSRIAWCKPPARYSMLIGVQTALCCVQRPPPPSTARPSRLWPPTSAAGPATRILDLGLIFTAWFPPLSSAVYTQCVDVPSQRVFFPSPLCILFLGRASVSHLRCCGQSARRHAGGAAPPTSKTGTKGPGPAWNAKASPAQYPGVVEGNQSTGKLIKFD